MKAAVKVGDGCIVSALSLASLYLEIDRLDDSIFVIEDALAACKNDDNTGLLAALSVYNYVGYNLDKADIYYDRAMKSLSCDSLCRKQLAVSRYYYRGNYKKALIELRGLFPRYMGQMETSDKDYYIYYNLYYILSNLYSLYDKRKKALEITKYLLEVTKRRYGTRNTLYAFMLTQMATLNYLERNYESAIENCKRARSILLENEITEDADNCKCEYITRSIRAQLSNVENQSRHIDSYIACMKRVYGKDTPDIATLYFTAAKAKYRYINHRQIKAMLNYALRIYENLKLYDHAWYGMIKEAIGALTLNQGNTERAIELLLESREIIAKSIGKQSSPYVEVSLHLSYAYTIAEYMSKAKEVIKEIEDKKYLDHASEEVRLKMIEIKCMLNIRERNMVEAETNCSRTLEKKREIYKVDNYSIAKSMGDMAIVKGRKGDYEKAESLLEKAIDIMKKSEFRVDESLIMLMEMLVYVYEENGKIEESRRLEKEVKKIIQNKHNVPRPPVSQDTEQGAE